MQRVHRFQQDDTRPILLSAVAMLATAIVPSLGRADRADDYAKLESEFEAAVEKFYASPKTAERTTAEKTRDYEAAPLWQFVPRFLALAEANPADETAYVSCKWILHYNLHDHKMVNAHRRVWKILAKHHVPGHKFPELCFLAAQNVGPTQENFLRGQLERKDLTREETAYATLALAVLLAQRVEYLEYMTVASELPKSDFVKYLEGRRSPDLGETLNMANLSKYKDESMRLFRVILDEYADVPNSLSMRYFRDIDKLADKAKKSLHALERLSLGAEAPDIVGKDLDGKDLELRDYRGRVVLLSFWYSGCGPCIEMVPKEREIVEKFKDRPFALLAVCADDDLEVGRAAAKEHGMNWPCWFDGDNGPIAQDYNILSWPTIYLFDKHGRIVSKDVERDHMDAAIEKLLNITSP